MEDRRAHERIDIVEKSLSKHLTEHSKFEKALAENVKMTTQIAANTSELVTILKNVKGVRSFFVWATPIVVSLAALVMWIRSIK